MSLRLRLIVAFFLLSVVPLAAVTFFTYHNSAQALREAAGEETELLAAELSQRMELVTAQLAQQVDHLMELYERTSGAAAESVTIDQAAAAAAVAAANQESARLGQLAMLLDNVNVEVRNPRAGGRGSPDGRRSGGGRRGGNGGGPTPPTGADSSQTGGARGATPTLEPPPDGERRGGRGGGQSPVQPGEGPPPGPPPEPPAEPVTADSPIRIDLTPIRREVMRQLATEEQLREMSDEERRRVFDQVNQQMLGIERGIRLGTEEAQRRIVEAQKAAEAKVVEATTRAATKAPSAQPSSGTPDAASTASTATRLRSALSGNRLDVTIERNGEIVRQGKGDVNLPNLLATVFATTRRDRGEVPFAVDQAGELYTQTGADRSLIQSIGATSTRSETAAGTEILPAWVIVTTMDPTGSGLKFGIARPVGDSLNELWDAMVRNTGLGLGLIGLALIGIVPLSSRLTRDLSVLSDGVHRIAEGDYRARLGITSHDEIGKLAQAFNQMAADVERHQRSAVEQERIRRELELGRQIQHEMLPQVPLRVGLTEIQGVSVPAREVGGDFFNYFLLPNGLVALLVGDVSGKGVGAALLMAKIQASLRTRLGLGQDLAAIAHEIDVDVEASTPGPVYSTLFIATLNPATREIQYVNAGHHPQYILRKHGGLERMVSSGLPVGLIAGHGYTEGRVALGAGDLLFFYTDGCVEAESEDGDMLGPERLEEMLARASAADTRDLLGYVEDSLRRFRGTREPFDDATMMVVNVG
jgi:serine phosphatase RsbU (regulator of sigma subunit)